MQGIKPVNPKGNQPWIFIGMTDAKAPLLWPHDAKSWLTGKDPDIEKDGAEEGDDRGWDGWMASLTQWTRVWVNSGSGWWTGRPGVLQSMGSPIAGHGWATEQQWERYLTKLRISIKKKNQKLWERTNRTDYIESVTKESKNWLGGAHSRYSFHRRNKWKWGKVKWEYTAWDTKGEKKKERGQRFRDKEESCCSVAKSRLIPSHPYRLEHTRLLCLPLSLGVCANLSPMSQWC